MAGHFVGHVIRSGTLAGLPASDAGPPVVAPDPAALAQALIEDAQNQAQQIVAQAEAAATAAIQRAKEAGEADGKAAAAIKFIELSERFHADMGGLEADIAELVSRAVERILATTPPRKKLEGVVRAAIRDLRDRRALVLKVPTEEAEFVTTAVSHYQEGRTHPIRSIEADDRLREGECRLSDGRSELRLDVETQLAALRATLALVETPTPRGLNG